MKIIQKLKDCWDVIRNKPRIIKTKLPSKRTFLEFEERVLYSTMECLRFYVEEDRGDHIFKTKKEVIKELGQMEKKGDPYSEDSKNHLFEIAEFEENLTKIYNWWNDVYTSFQNIDIFSTSSNKIDADRQLFSYKNNEEVVCWDKEDGELEQQADEYLEFLMKNRRRIWC